MLHWISNSLMLILCLLVICFSEPGIDILKPLLMIFLSQNCDVLSLWVILEVVALQLHELVKPIFAESLALTRVLPSSPSEILF